MWFKKRTRQIRHKNIWRGCISKSDSFTFFVNRIKEKKWPLNWKPKQKKHVCKNCVTRSVAFIGIFPSSLPQPSSKDLNTPFNILHLFLSSLFNIRGEGKKTERCVQTRQLDFSIKIQMKQLRNETGMFHLRSLWNWDILYWWSDR